MKSKERLTDILVSFDEGAMIYGYRTDGETITLLGKDGENLTPSYAAVGTGYERDSGKFKSTMRVTSDPLHITGNVSAWISRYDRIFAVDTNSIDLDGDHLSVTCCIRAEIELIENRWSARIDAIDALVAFQPKFKPELVGWLDVISRINIDPKLKIGLVVDSELGLIPEMNLRRVPIADGTYLPSNIELVYASSDQDRNLPFNALIAKCDADASLLLKLIAQDRCRLENLLRPSEGTHYASSYHWPPKRQ